MQSSARGRQVTGRSSSTANQNLRREGIEVWGAIIRMAPVVGMEIDLRQSGLVLRRGDGYVGEANALVSQQHDPHLAASVTQLDSEAAQRTSMVPEVARGHHRAHHQGDQQGAPKGMNVPRRGPRKDRGGQREEPGHALG